MMGFGTAEFDYPEVIVGKFVDRKLRAKEAGRFLGIGRTRLHHLAAIYGCNWGQRIK